MADVTKIIEAFSVTHAAILDGDTGAEEVNGDIYGVENASIAPDLGSYDNVGDDVVKSTWKWFNKATISIQAGYVPFDLLNLIFGPTTSSSGSGASLRHEQPLWEKQGQNVTTKPLLIRCEAKDSNKNTRWFEFIFYSCQFAPISFTGPAYKDGLKINYTAEALMSSTNEAGETLTYEAVGRLISRQKT